MYIIQRKTLSGNDEEFIDSRDTEGDAKREVKRLNKEAKDNSYSYVSHSD